jgi:spore coat protein CotH
MSLKFKRHYKLLVLLVLVSAVLILGVGNQGIIAYTVQDNEQLVEQGITYSSDVALFDDTVIHSVQILISDATGNE